MGIVSVALIVCGFILGGLLSERSGHTSACLFSDSDGQHAAEELRLLRAWEAAQRNVYDTHCGEPRTQEEKDAQERAIIREEEAWTALDAFRETK